MQVEAQTVHDGLAFGGVEKLADSEQWVPVPNGQQLRCSQIRRYSINFFVRIGKFNPVLMLQRSKQRTPFERSLHQPGELFG